MEVIDSHVHLACFRNEKLDLKRKITDLKECMRLGGVSKSIIIQVIGGIDDYRFFIEHKRSEGPAASLEEIYDIIKDDPSLALVGSVSICKGTNKERAALKKAASENKVVGIKIYTGYEKIYPCDKRCDFVYDICEKYDIPVIFHTGATYGAHAEIRYAAPINIDDLAIKRSNLKIIIAHAGNPWIEDAMLVVSRHSNVYADLSGFFDTRLDGSESFFVRQNINRMVCWCYGGDKFLFGTDWPINSNECGGNLMKEYIRFIRSTAIPKKDLELVFSGNAKKLFKI